MKKFLLLMFAVLLIAVGINKGGMNDTLRKANKICLECIGIG